MSNKVVNILPSRNRGTLRKRMEDAHKRLRMTPPHSDPDVRLKKVWESLEQTWMDNQGITIELVEEFDYQTLVDPTYEWMGNFQVRENNTLPERIKKNKIRFFGNKPESLQKSPIIFEFFDEEEIVRAPIVGNGRGYCFKEMESLQPAIVIKFPSETPLVDVLDAALEAASRSNTNQSSDVEPEEEGDVVQQLRTKYRTLMMRNPKIKKEECVPALLKMLMDKPDYDKPEQASYRTRLINTALQLGHSEPTPPPTPDEVDEQWKGFFGVDFNLSNTTNVDKLCDTGYQADIERSLYLSWKNAPDQRKDAWIVARIGAATGGKALTSISSVVTGRVKMLKYFADMNTNPKRVKGNHQLITRVMFQKQLTDKDNKCIAFEWCPDSAQFIEKSC